MPSAIVGGVCLKGEKSMCKEIQIDSFQEVAVRLVRMPASHCQDPAVDSPGKAALFMASLLGDCTVENMAVVMTDTRLKPLCYSVVSRGSIDMACYSPAEILRVAILSNAAGVFCFHNHPSGNPSPSKEDDAVASNLSDALRLCMTLSSLADLSFFPTGNRGVARIGGILPPVQQRSLRRSESKKYMAAQSPQGLSAAIFFYGSDWKWACPVMPYFFKYSSCSPSRRKSRGRFR